MSEKPSHYLTAGSPLACFLPSCRKPFDQACHHGEDGHYYCSRECADAGRKIDLAKVEELRPIASALPPPRQKLLMGRQ